MTWTLLWILGVPLGMVIGALLSAAWYRRRLRSQPDVFPCKARVRSGYYDGLPAEWSHMSFRGLWVHNVLMIHSGIGFVRVSPLGVRFVNSTVAAVDGVKGLHEYPVSMLATLDGGAVIEVAARGTDATLLAGPFVTAVVDRQSRITFW